MRILIVDDDPERHSVFARALKASHELVQAYNYSEAVEALKSAQRFDVAFLDRDLGDFNVLREEFSAEHGREWVASRGGYGEPCELTGEDVAEVIVRMGEAAWPTRIVVHS